MNRLEALAEVLKVSHSEIKTRISGVTAGEEDEFYLKQEGEDVYYDVLLEEEFADRLVSLLECCYTEDELEEAYGTRNAEDANADINTYLRLVGQVENYFIYTA